MQSKYLNAGGANAVHIWVFATLLAELKKTPNREKTQEVYQRALQLAENQEFKYHATPEEISDLKKVVDNLKALL